MDTECIVGQTKASMQVNGQITQSMGEGSMCGAIADNTKVIG